MPIEGKLGSLYVDKEQTQPLFPRTKTKAITDDDNIRLDIILDSLKTTVNSKASETFVNNAINGIDHPVDSVNGKTGNVTLSASDVGAVPTSRTVNGKALSENITLSASDVSARPSTWMPSASDVGAIAKTGGEVSGYLNFSNLTAGLKWTTADGTIIQLRPYSAGNNFQLTMQNPTTGVTEYGVINIWTDGTWSFGAPDKVRTALGAVPTSRTVNGKALSENITLSASDVSARPSTWMPSASDVGAVSTAGGTIDGELTIKDSLRFWTDNEGGNIRICPPASNTYTDYWDIDSYDSNTLRIFAYKKSTNPNGGPGYVFPLTISTDGSIYVANTAKTRANLGVAPAAEGTECLGCYYRTVDGVTEWINPPMSAGTEYRTTERFNGKVVYTKLINYGKLAAANTNVSISLGGKITNLVDVNGFVTLSSGNTYTAPTFSFNETLPLLTFYLNNGKTALVARCQSDLSTATAVFIVKYTKN